MKTDEDDGDSSSAKEDVNTEVPPPSVSDDNVGKCMPKPVRNFDQEQKQIQVILCLVFFSDFGYLHFPLSFYDWNLM